MATPRLANVKLEAADGGPLRLDVRTGARPGEARPAIVICHGFKGFKDWGFFPRAADRLALAGFTVLSFNFSGSGVADGDQFTEIERWFRQRPSTDLQDIGLVVDHAEELGAPWIGLLGHSRGGGLAILHASRDPRIGALVTWAAIDHFLRFTQDEVQRWRHEGRLDVVNSRTGQVLTMGPAALEDIDRHQDGMLDVATAAGRLRLPWLLIHGAGDPTVPVETAERLADLSGSERTESLIVEDADHTFGIRHPWAGSTPHFDRALDATLSFLVQAMG